MPEKPRIVVITGAESTGKSELSKRLSEFYRVPYYHEFAREYIEGINRKYNYHDIEVIAEKQYEQYLEALNSAAEYVFFDTWLIITKIWFETVYKKCPEWISPTIANAKIFTFLLCSTDLPWVPDPVRENGGTKRLELHKKYKTAIRNYGFSCFEIGGFEEKRVQNAIAVLNNL